jgi:hypothetical protein
MSAVSSTSPLTEDGAVDLRTILFSVIVLMLGCMNDYVIKALKSRHPTLETSTPDFFRNKLFGWAAAGMIMAVAVGNGMSQRRIYCEKNVAECAAQGALDQMVEIPKLGIIYIFSRLEVVAAAPFIWFGSSWRSVVCWAAVYAYFVLVVVRNLLEIHVDKSLYIPLVCMISVRSQFAYFFRTSHHGRKYSS